MKERLIDFFQDVPAPFTGALVVLAVLVGAGLFLGLRKRRRAGRRSEMKYCRPQILNPVIRKI